MKIPAPIKPGSFGAIVTAIQNFLLGQGIVLGTVDGRYGPKTQEAVVAYQTRERLVADGIVGNRTLGRMLEQGLALMTTPDNDTSGAYPPGFPARPNFSPLTTNAQRSEVFGLFHYVPAPVPGNPEAIRITDGWEEKHIKVTVIPQLVKTGVDDDGKVRLHRIVEPQTLGLWLAWEISGLLKHVESWEGMYVPRFIRRSRSTLSNHAFGTAFDINAARNGLGRIPAAVGAAGSVRELVPLAHRFGFFWGGHFGRADGMHFEVARVLSEESVGEVLGSLKP